MIRRFLSRECSARSSKFPLRAGAFGFALHEGPELRACRLSAELSRQILREPVAVAANVLNKRDDEAPRYVAREPT